MITYVRFNEFKVCINNKQTMILLTVPSAIIDQLSSSDMVAEEGDTVMLVCNVTGVPHPEVTWFRLPTQAGTQKESRLHEASYSPVFYTRCGESARIKT